MCLLFTSITIRLERNINFKAYALKLIYIYNMINLQTLLKSICVVCYL